MSPCCQGFPEALDEIGEHPAANLLILCVTVRYCCHNAGGINDALQTHEFVVESR